MVEPKLNWSKTWRDVLPIHPAAELFPALSHDELLELGNDIKKNGLKSPIALWATGDNEVCGEYQLLDGRNRLDAMELVGLQTIEKGRDGKYELYSCLGGRSHLQNHGSPIVRLHEFTKFHAFSFGGKDALGKAQRKPDTDPYAYALSVNIHRRHLTSEQKNELTAKLLKANPNRSNHTIGKLVKRDPKTVGKIRDKLEAGGEIPHQETRKDKRGHNQPARKKRASGKVADALIDSTPTSRVGEKPSMQQPSGDHLKTEINAFHGKLVGFFSDFEEGFNKWHDARPLIDEDGKAALMKAFYLCADGFARLAQKLDGR